MKAEKLVRYRDVVQLGSAAVEKVGGWLPDVVHEPVAKSELCDVWKVKLQAVILPPLPEVNLHGVGLFSRDK